MIGGLLRDAVRGLRRRRRRTLLSALGVALAAAMLSTSAVLAIDLGGGFDRAVRASDLPDIIARFDPVSRARVLARISALPGLAAYATRMEFPKVRIAARGHSSDQTSAEVIGPGRRGYAIVGGRDVSARPGQVVVERGLAQAWGVRLGDRLYVGGVGPQRVVGFAQSPDNVSYPLAVPRIYLSERALDARFGPDPHPQANVAELWLRDPAQLNTVLVQARMTSFGLRGLRLVTRSGVRVLLDQAAGIVIDLLVALSLFALATAAVMLAASARVEVARRIRSLGVGRALGAGRTYLAAGPALEAGLIAVPAATAGTLLGLLAATIPGDRLLILLNQPPAGPGLILPLAGVWALSVGLPVLASAWPAARAASRSPIALLRGDGLTPARAGRRRRGAAAGGLVRLGARLLTARPLRFAATLGTLGASVAFVLLLLALAAALSTLETDPQALGKRYQLTAALGAELTPQVRALPGVADAAPRYELRALDAFSLGETIDVVGYPGDHTSLEAPPLTQGRRLRGRGQTEVGAGLADALGLAPGSTLALLLPSGRELRLRVAGVVSSLANDGRVAYVPAAALLAGDPSAPEQVVVRLTPGADANAVNAALTGLGSAPQAASGAVGRGVPLVSTLRTILIVIAVVDGLVCLYALVQSCALTLEERRRTVATLRATGAGPAAVARLLAGVVGALVVPAALIGIALERLVLGPGLSQLAAGYASLDLGAGQTEIAAAAGGLLLAAALAVAWATRRATRAPVVAGLGA